MVSWAESYAFDGLLTLLCVIKISAYSFKNY